MTKIEIAQHIANAHNRLTQIQVCGDGAILMGDTLKELRLLVQELQKDIEAEEALAAEAAEEEQAENKE